MTRLFLDDERDPRGWLPEMAWYRGRDPSELEEWIWVKTAPGAIHLLGTTDVVEVSLDHDLGPEEDVGTGYDVLTWIEHRVATDGWYGPPEIHIHTSNLAARERMEAAVRSIENLARRRATPR